MQRPGALTYSPFESLSVARPVDRIDYVKRRCAGLRVPDLGATDETEVTKKQHSSWRWLHAEIAAVARELLGVDSSAQVRSQGGIQTSRQSPGAFDLIVLCDVLHHIAVPLRPDVLSSVRRLLRAGGTVVIKEWERRYNLMHLIGYLSDRWLTGGRVHYLRREELCESICAAFGSDAIVEEHRLPPWRNNLAFIVQPR